MRKVIFSLGTFLFVSCGSQTSESGPCTYELDTVPATIIRMDSTGTPYPDMTLTVPSKLNGTDTLNYSYYVEEIPTWEIATERGYAIGARLKCIREYRTKGNCDPEIYSLTKEIYK